MDIIGQAVWVHKHTNIEYFEHLLAAFQAAAISEGFDFIEGTEQYVLSEVELDHFGQAIYRARCRSLSPRATDSQLARWISDAVEDGGALQWVQTILNALQSRGIVLVRVHKRVYPDMAVEAHASLQNDVDNDADLSSIVNIMNEYWTKHAYPLQQITIQLQGTRHSSRDDVIDQLEAVLARLKKGELEGSSHDDDFGYQFQVQPAAPGPSFFDAPAGDN